MTVFRGYGRLRYAVPLKSALTCCSERIGELLSDFMNHIRLSFLQVAEAAARRHRLRHHRHEEKQKVKERLPPFWRAPVGCSW